ncbi:site-2 protease family protein [Ornithinimicrobium tianjinense]|uniref:Zinc metalloprotease n=1 Tax=Ornithinimicrobium tianjinense TaxID=1195761 RepID=A0A917BLW8_9MICO|nr:site-2 protease family protein [Ornithinimicrobium tianjinense]GGF47586.1 peptidase M50 [Ornithinimicrobium tianjinense]
MSETTTGQHGWRIGRLSGVPVYLGRSWILVAVLIAAVFGPTVTRTLPGLGPTGYVVALAFAVLLLLSVLVHEAAHALVAQRVGFRVSRIVADFWGGHTAHDGSGGTPGRSAAVAVVGPLSNGLLALLGWWLLGHVDAPVPFLLLAAFTYANAFVAVFNLIPGLPLDGGFLLESLVWQLSGNRHLGTLVAGWAGRAAVVVIVLWALRPVLLEGQQLDITRVLWVMVIGLFLWQGAGQAVRAGRQGLHVSRRRVGDAARRVGVVGADEPVSAVDWAAHPLWVVVDPSGGPVGVVDPGALRSLPEAARAVATAASLTVRLPAGWAITLDEDDPLDRAVDVMRRTGSGVVGLLDRSGRPWGVVLVDDVSGRSAPSARS